MNCDSRGFQRLLIIAHPRPYIPVRVRYSHRLDVGMAVKRVPSKAIPRLLRIRHSVASPKVRQTLRESCHLLRKDPMTLKLLCSTTPLTPHNSCSAWWGLDCVYKQLICLAEVYHVTFITNRASPHALPRRRWQAGHVFSAASGLRISYTKIDKNQALEGKALP